MLMIFNAATLTNHSKLSNYFRLKAKHGGKLGSCKFILI